MIDHSLSPRARRDLREIWGFTFERWGKDQADRYIVRLHRAIEIVAGNPTRGRSCDNLRAGYWRYSAGAHVLFYRLVADQVVIMRVLHQSMDFARHL